MTGIYVSVNKNTLITGRIQIDKRTRYLAKIADFLINRINDTYVFILLHININLNINILANIWSSIKSSILLPPKPIQFIFLVFG